MAGRFFRLFFWGILVASLLAWFVAGLVTAEFREAILVEDKFTGIEDGPILPGETRFVPAAAVPGRVRLHSVDLGPRMLVIHTRYALPDAVFYGLEETLAIEMRLYYQYELTPQQLRTLFMNLPEPDWRSLDEYLAVRINAYWKQKMYGWLRDGNENQIEEKLRESISNGLNSEMSEYFAPEGIRFNRILLDSVFVPDAARSRALLARAPELIERKLETDRIIDEARARSRANQILNQGYYERLETMAGLLARHPELREYVAVDQLSDKVRVMVLPHEKFFGSSQGQRQSVFDQVQSLDPSVMQREDPSMQERPAIREVAPENYSREQTPMYRPQYRNQNRPANGNLNGNFVDLTPP